MKVGIDDLYANLNRDGKPDLIHLQVNQRKDSFDDLYRNKEICKVLAYLAAHPNLPHSIADLAKQIFNAPPDTEGKVNPSQVSRGLSGIRAAFGASFIAADGSLDRVRMRAHVFADASERKRLEAILHPMIRRACEAERETATSPYAMLVVPLLFESRANRSATPTSSSARASVPIVQRTLLVTCDERVQIERVMRRSGMSDAEVSAIIAAQMPAAQRIALVYREMSFCKSARSWCSL